MKSFTIALVTTLLVSHGAPGFATAAANPCQDEAKLCGGIDPAKLDRQAYRAEMKNCLFAKLAANRGAAKGGEDARFSPKCAKRLERWAARQKAIRVACSGDIERHCGDIAAGAPDAGPAVGRRIAGCLKEHKPLVSPRCKAARQQRD